MWQNKKLTLASWSNLPKSSLSSRTNSCAVHCDASTVKPTMSANKMLKQTNAQSAQTLRRHFKSQPSNQLLNADRSSHQNKNTSYE